ncbi:hypothetical protein COLO4_22107 [Corchorus olitorius]|uniref:Uncharacterized protein n=1 Tax=Corchorus olitorius TaxID=93759 RepID=A0A1R3IP67_9ROSI|nr:hypothetical protein COLO4_22107 [Corchorus olitorius]
MPSQQGKPSSKKIWKGKTYRGRGRPRKIPNNDSPKLLVNCLQQPTIFTKPRTKRHTLRTKPNQALTSQLIAEDHLRYSCNSEGGSSNIKLTFKLSSAPSSSPPSSNTSISTSTAYSEIVIPGPIPDLDELINDKTLFLGNFFDGFEELEV